MNDVLREKLARLPDAPGCYLMKDASGAIIYVGKAANLKNRVRSYFHGQHDPKTELLAANIVDFDTVVVESEAEALILEANLIKQHSPHYNILLRDDKHYPYLRLTLDEDFPRLLVARRARPDGSKYFGPYPNVTDMRRALETIMTVFPLRTCNGRNFRAGQRACLNAHIGRCLAPCEGRVSREEYAALVQDVSGFLSGKTRQLIRQEEERMQQAAEELRFEDAARHRDAAQRLKQLQERQHVDMGTGSGDYDLLAVKAAEDTAVAQLFYVRAGNVIGRDHFFLNRQLDEPEDRIVSRFLQDYYGGGSYFPAQLYCSQLPEDAEALAEAFAAQCGHKVRFTLPARGDKRRLLNLVEENARLVLDNYLHSRQRREERGSLALEELRQALDLPTAPVRMECYDISHVQGAHMVGSMAVFLHGEPEPRLYRRFKIKTLTESNDFAALQEVVTRRFVHGREERAAGKSGGFADFPDLMVIDGGKGQLSAVVEALAALGATRQPIISLAKEEEEVFLPGRSDPLRLPRESAALQVLQRLRDEAHRFAVGYHRRLRGKGQTRSLLDDAPGIGPERRKSLLKCFGSLQNLRAARLAELAAAPKMNAKAAAELYAFLHAAEAAPETDHHE